ncbi:MAG: hypothetical protein ACI9H8_001162 [Lysobacterales bacterium]
MRDIDSVNLYRFATNSADFILCATCGVYVGAIVNHEGLKYATLNMNITALDTSNARPIVHGDALAEVRLAQRAESFTPVVNCPF